MSDNIDIATLLEGHERYQFIRLLGEGGCAFVALVLDKYTNVQAALKVLKFKDTEPVPKIVLRFWREVGALQQIHHQNVIAIHWSGKVGEYPAVAMEKMDASLFDLICASGSMAPAEAVRVMIETLTGISVAHTRGIIHRDIKPHNVLVRLNEQGRISEVKVCDFGIARGSTGAGRFTMDGRFMGSLAYMAPEQQTHPKDAGVTADVFSAGVTLYHLLVGELDDSRAIGISLSQSLRKGGSLPGNIPEPLARVICKALAEEPSDRYQSAEEMIEALRQIRRSATAVPYTDPEESDPEPVFVPEQRRPRLLFGAVAVVAVLMFGCAGAISWAFWSESPAKVVEAPAIVEVAVPEPELVSIIAPPELTSEPEVVVNPEKPRAVPRTTPNPSLEKEGGQTSQTTKAKVKIAVPEPIPPPEVEPDPPEPTTGTVSITGEYHQARLQGENGAEYRFGVPLPAGSYRLFVKFDEHGSENELGKVQVEEGQNTSIDCPKGKFDCR